MCPKSSSCFMKPWLGSHMERACRRCDNASEGVIWCFCIKKAMTTVAERDLPMALEEQDRWHGVCTR